jgi:ATP-dependent RNA helicase DeaD
MQDPSSFEDLNVEIPDDVLAGIRDLGWQTPMPVQTRVIPPLREGNDLIVQARTGSGKTGELDRSLECGDAGPGSPTDP